MGLMEPGRVIPTLSKNFFVNSEVVAGKKVLPGKKTAVGLREESMALRAALYLVRQYPGVESSQ
jgi:hypothetical protein